jgi:hypothetical protein
LVLSPPFFNRGRKEAAVNYMVSVVDFSIFGLLDEGDQVERKGTYVMGSNICSENIIPLLEFTPQ